MTIREIHSDELNGLLELYTHLHGNPIPESSEKLTMLWEKICADDDHHIIIAEADGKVVSSCVCVIIPNLTHGQNPYALIENVVTMPEYRKQGYASACLEYAVDIAKSSSCYKIMLLTGSKEESTLRFYERAGFNRNDKTAFIRWL